MTAKQFHKFVDWIVKLAVLILQVPVTWVVAGATFGDFGGIVWMGYRFEWVWILQACAVLLADGVLLSNWLSLELDKKATPEVKSRYVIGAWIQFAVMLIIALQHGEGLIGLAFRISFAVALAGSTWDTIAHTWKKLRESVGKEGVEADWRVRIHHRKLDRQEARYRRVSEARVHCAGVDANEVVLLARVEAEQVSQLEAIIEGQERQPQQLPFPFGVGQENGRSGVTPEVVGETRQDGVSGA